VIIFVFTLKIVRALRPENRLYQKDVGMKISRCICPQ